MADIQVAGPTFKDFSDYVLNTETVITPHLSGFVNIEGGQMSIASTLLTSCDECFGYTNDATSYECATCGRNPENYVFFRSGFGDGIYPVFELSWDGKILGTMTIMDQGSAFAGGFSDIPQGISDKSLPLNAGIEYFWKYFEGINPDLTIDYLATLQGIHDPIWSTLDDPFGTFFFADSGVSSDPQSAVVTAKDIRVASQDVYIFSEREPENYNVLVPQIALTIDSELAKELGLPSQNVKLDIKTEVENWSKSTVMCHVGTRAEAAIGMNILYELALLGKGYHDQLSEVDHMMITMSWRIHLDVLTGNRFDQMDTLLAEYSAKQISWIYLMRGFVTLSRTFYDPETGQEGVAYKELMARVERGSESATESGLPKNGSGLSGGQKIGGPSQQPGSPGIGGSGTTLARFCSNCGTGFSTDSDKFCGNCGSPRGN